MFTGMDIARIAFYILILLLFVKPLGLYMVNVYEGKFSGPYQIGGMLERLIYRLCFIKTKKEMDWKQYLSAMLFLNLFGVLITYLIQRFQFYLPLNPQQFIAPSADSAFNTATSFVSNTDWQSYSGETTMSYLTQMFALTAQNFISAATGMSLLIALIRGITKCEAWKLGNFWVDVVRSVLYILLPLSFVLALILVSQGVIQNFKPNQTVELLQATKNNISQVLPMGPVASQIAIKQLGTNGGGFFNANSAHPFENPTPFSNFLEVLAILLLPAAFCYTFGVMVKDKRQGWAILVAMFIIFVPFLFLDVFFEQAGNPALSQMNVNQLPLDGLSPGGNMEGKETRFGILDSALWAVATTAASNGSTNSALDSYTPIGGMIPLWMMHLGEVIFGGIGSGLYGMLLFVIITVFIAGLMVGRTPEYLGKKIEPFEMKMAALAVLIMPLIVLISTAIASVTKMGVSAIANPGPHGLTEILYAFTSMGNNNGSAFAGLNTNTMFYNLLGGFVMLIGRFWVAIPMLAIAGSLVQKKVIPKTSGTLATHTPLFIILLVSVTILLGALSFFPALALGPIVEQLMLGVQYGD